MQTFKSLLIFGHVQGMWQTMPQMMIPDHWQFTTLGQEGIRITEAWTEGVHIMLAHVTETVCRVSCSTSAELLTCCYHHVRSISWLYRSASELPDTAYVASTRMQTTITYTITKNQTHTREVIFQEESAWIWQLRYGTPNFNTLKQMENECN